MTRPTLFDRRAALGCGLAALAASPRIAKAQPGLPDVIRQVKPSVVGIGTFQPMRAISAQLSGSGFVVADGRHVITNAHVIKSKDEKLGQSISVLIGNGASVDRRNAATVSVDQEHDLALLRIDGPALPPVRLWPNANLVPEGTDVACTGFPIGAALGLIPATHHGVIAAHAPNIVPMPDSRFLDAHLIRSPRFLVYQLDMVAYPGNSGSPLYLVPGGEVIGVINSTFVKDTREKALSEPSGISFAIPTGFVHQLLVTAGVAR